MAVPARKVAHILNPSRLARNRDWALLAPSLLFLGVFVAALVLLGEYSSYTFSGGVLHTTSSGKAYHDFATSSFSLHLVKETLRLGAEVTVVTLLVGYPAAYALSRLEHRVAKVAMYAALFAPLLVSVIVRTYGWMLLLADGGPINYVLLHVGLIGQPIQLIYNFTGVTIAMVHVLLPFMVFPILVSFRQLDRSYTEAARDLNASHAAVFLRVVLPLTLPGVVAGSQLVFSFAVTAFVSPELLGGGRVQVLASQIYTDVTTSLNWPMGAVLSFALVGLTLALLGSFTLVARRRYANV